MTRAAASAPTGTSPSRTLSSASAQRRGVEATGWKTAPSANSGFSVAASSSTASSRAAPRAHRAARRPRAAGSGARRDPGAARRDARRRTARRIVVLTATRPGRVAPARPARRTPPRCPTCVEGERGDGERGVEQLAQRRPTPASATASVAAFELMSGSASPGPMPGTAGRRPPARASRHPPPRARARAGRAR